MATPSSTFQTKNHPFNTLPKQRHLHRHQSFARQAPHVPAYSEWIDILSGLARYRGLLITTFPPACTPQPPHRPPHPQHRTRHETQAIWSRTPIHTNDTTKRPR
ncbi:hypothetical protein CC80DRAFT_45884 [Byssothecium circinans]|uniref:Uncharacterized protein n=1 Tax=Byssothecium circinans TaxID=147558 RepID=A0A6A5TX97_9PLEO|nr:hypothetical protein CC80DRAFT_45884 [Byssothecium circinans]